MSIKQLNHHYSMENPASVYDEEALTALELAGRTTAKVNEVVTFVNEFTDEVKAWEEKTGEAVDNFITVADEVLMHTQNRLNTFANETIPDTVEQVTREKIESGALDHVVQESIDILGTELDALLNAGTNAANASAEITAARVGNGGVTFPTLGDAIREQTTNIKPERLNPEGGEWKGDNQVPTYQVELGCYWKLSGFVRTKVTSASHDAYTYKVEGGREYLYTCAREITDTEIANGWFIFENAYDFEVSVGGTSLHNFVTLVDSENWVYRIKAPHGCGQMFTVRPKDTQPELWLLSTEQQLKWLRVNRDNLEPDSVTPVNISRSTGPWFRDVKYRRKMHVYKSSNGQTISENTMTGMCECVVEGVQPGQVYRVPVGKDVSNSLGNYFVFENADGAPAVQDIAKYVELIGDGTEYIYHATIPEGCVTFYTACDATTQLLIQEVYDRVSLPWLKVTQDNLEGVSIEGGRNYNYDYIWKKPEWESLNVLCIGDSIMAGIYSESGGGTSATAYGSPIERFCSKVGANLANLSVSGSTYRSWARGDHGDILEHLNTHMPDVVIVALGINDYLSEDSIFSTSFWIACDSLISRIKGWLNEYPDSIGIAITPFDCDFGDGNTKNMHGYTLDHFRKYIAACCMEPVDNVDNNPENDVYHGEMLCVDGAGAPLKMFTLYDGLHPAFRAQNMLANWLRMKLT